MKRGWLLYGVLYGVMVLIGAQYVFIRAQTQTDPPPAKTRVEELLEQNTVLLQRLAQLSAALAQCEVNGPQSAQFQRQAQESATELQKSLASRGLVLKPDGTLGPLSTADPPPRSPN